MQSAWRDGVEQQMTELKVNMASVHKKLDLLLEGSRSGGAGSGALQNRTADHITLSPRTHVECNGRERETGLVHLAPNIATCSVTSVSEDLVGAYPTSGVQGFVEDREEWGDGLSGGRPSTEHVGKNKAGVTPLEAAFGLQGGEPDIFLEKRSSKSGPNAKRARSEPGRRSDNPVQP
ncbi:hypothetical protein M758_UG217700 [Ceratodon purpureus]|nr:hypothetical protein M758_UG217700 [Ceratodon purpureus]